MSPETEWKRVDIDGFPHFCTDAKLSVGMPSHITHDQARWLAEVTGECCALLFVPDSDSWPEMKLPKHIPWPTRFEAFKLRMRSDEP